MEVVTHLVNDTVEFYKWSLTIAGKLGSPVPDPLAPAPWLPVCTYVKILILLCSICQLKAKTVSFFMHGSIAFPCLIFKVSIDGLWTV